MLQNIKDWVHAPFVTPFNPESVFLITGIVIIGAVAWSMALRHITAGVEAAV